VRIVPIGHALLLLDNGVFLDIEAKQTHWTVKKKFDGKRTCPVKIGHDDQINSYQKNIF
jgi:hypothetical protein